LTLVGRSAGSQITMIAGWRTRDEDLATAVARDEAVRLAKRVNALDEELKANTKRITELVNQSPARGLLEQPGIGPVTAAVALTAWSHPGRVRSEAAFASLAGVNPIPASSGNTVRHRINRGGDRRLNRALHMAAITRMRMDPRTRAYVERRTTEGRTLKEIRRCLKRYLARQIYRHLNAAAQSEPLPWPTFVGWSETDEGDAVIHEVEVEEPFAEGRAPVVAVAVDLVGSLATRNEALVGA
jgi:transposase